MTLRRHWAPVSIPSPPSHAPADGAACAHTGTTPRDAVTQADNAHTCPNSPPLHAHRHTMTHVHTQPTGKTAPHRRRRHARTHRQMLLRHLHPSQAPHCMHMQMMPCTHAQCTGAASRTMLCTQTGSQRRVHTASPGQTTNTAGKFYNGYRWHRGYRQYHICLVRVYTRTCYD